MPFLKFKLITLALFLFSFNASSYTRKECLEKNFDMNVTHKGALWGLLKNTLIVKKENCLITLTYQKHHPKIPGDSWKVDVCREPVHIKYLRGGVEVFKREGVCDLETKGKMNDFCYNTKNILVAIQDEGLIFAEGEKENLSTQHGQVYCAYDVLKDYLIRGIVLSRYAKEVLIAEPAPKDDSTLSEEEKARGDY